MTTLHTRPIPQQTTLTMHEHAWLTESRHRTSEGIVTYVRCAACSARRVDLQSRPQLPPVALSRSVDTAS
ncbi:hypothetical protein [Microbacterium sp. Bi121]|uniref:hypothetical protein n=1 Tax=Microbacterium sp. Bi121 TaxID=2822348 RepID=UPI001E3D6646|nr:hypothetical protein [Microbacterium sp. Bi121]